MTRILRLTTASALSLLLLTSAAAAQQESDAFVIKAVEIAALQAQKVPDVLNHVPGVSATGSSVSIQGSTKVKVFLDGRPINDPTSASAVEWDLVNLDNVSTIEIHRGKGAVKYGQDATGGVILITTKKTSALTGNVKLYGGNQASWNGTVAVQSVSGRLTSGFNGNFETTDGYTVNSDKERWRGGGKLEYKVSNEAAVSISSDYARDRRGQTGYPDFPTPYARRKGYLSSSAVQARYGSLVNNTTLVMSSNRNTDISINLDRTISVTEFGDNVVDERKSARWGSTSYGAGILATRGSGTSFTEKNEQTYSLFAVQSLPKGRIPVSLSLGLRANINSAFDDALNPEVKASYGPSTWQLTGAYGRSNNTPSMSARYNESSTTKPNPDLRMETAQNSSVGLSNTWSSAFSTEVDAFYNRLRDRITFVVFGDGTATHLNVGKVRYAGGDASLSWKPLKSMMIKGSYGFLDATDTDTGNWLPGKSRHAGSLLVQVRPHNTVSVSLIARAQSHAFRDTRNVVAIPAYWLAEVKVEHTRGRATIFSEASNLLDRSYLSSDGYLAPPRTWFIGVNYKI